MLRLSWLQIWVFWWVYFNLRKKSTSGWWKWPGKALWWDCWNPLFKARNIFELLNQYKASLYVLGSFSSKIVHSTSFLSSYQHLHSHHDRESLSGSRSLQPTLVAKVWSSQVKSKFAVHLLKLVCTYYRMATPETTLQHWQQLETTKGVACACWSRQKSNAWGPCPVGRVENIARIANAVQVTTCLLVSTSAY